MQYLIQIGLFFGVLSCVKCNAVLKINTDSSNNDFAFPRPNLKLVGAIQASPHQFPYQVGMYITSSANQITFCGGSLVSPNYVLTAAHCAVNAKQIQIILGAQDITQNEEDQIKMTTTNFTVHSGWDNKTLENDIALLALPHSVNVSNKINVVKLAKGNDSYIGGNGTVSGWGRTYDTQSTLSANLLYFVNKIISNEECKSASDSYNKTIQDTHLCLSGEGEKSICQGDSGGPLVDDGVQVGVVSFGWKSCEQSKPSVFTRVSEYTDWIQEHSDVKFS